MTVVLSLTKNVSLWNDAFAYHMTMTCGVIVGGGDSSGGWVVGEVMLKYVVKVAVWSVVGVLYLVFTWWLCWWL